MTSLLNYFNTHKSPILFKLVILLVALQTVAHIGMIPWIHS